MITPHSLRSILSHPTQIGGGERNNGLTVNGSVNVGQKLVVQGVDILKELIRMQHHISSLEHQVCSLKNIIVEEVLMKHLPEDVIKHVLTYM